MINDIKLYNEIGNKIKEQRKKMGITQEKLAELTNYSLSFISNIESRTYQTFSTSALNNIAKELNTTITNLLPKEELLTYQKNEIKCGYCNYNVEIPQELFLLLETIKNLNDKHFKLTCPKCKKIM